MMTALALTVRVPLSSLVQITFQVPSPAGSSLSAWMIDDGLVEVGDLLRLGGQEHGDVMVQHVLHGVGAFTHQCTDQLSVAQELGAVVDVVEPVFLIGA